MVKKRYQIKVDGNIKDALRTGRVKFSCVSKDMDPFEKTMKLAQSKATRDHYCRPAFYEDLENIPAGGKKIKMSLIWNGVNFKVDYPDWISMTKINEQDNISPVQYWLEISPNVGSSRYGKLKISYELDGLQYSDTYSITQYGKDVNSMVGTIECIPAHLQTVDYEKNVIEINVIYKGIRKIEEPFFSPYDQPWIKIQKTNEYKSTDSTTIVYNVIFEENVEPNPRLSAIKFSGIGDNGKMEVTSCEVFQFANPNA